jgi:transposase
VERSFALTLDRGGLRRMRLRGRDNVQKRYCVHAAGYNLGLVMRALLGAGTPRQLAARGARLLWLLSPDIGLLVILLPPDAPPDPTSSTAC